MSNETLTINIDQKKINFQLKTVENCNKVELVSILKDISTLILIDCHIPNKWNNTNIKNSEGYPLAQFKIN